ncbi:MAG: nucleotide exchange factor GrpE [Halobacteriales archaeon]
MTEATERDEEPAEEPADAAEDEESATAESIDDRIARVAVEDEALAAEIEAEFDTLRDQRDELQAELEDAKAEIEDLESRLKRTQADFQNYKKRKKDEQERIKERATEDLVGRLLEVRDNLSRALEQDASTDIRDGVEATLNAFDRILADENVEVVEPEPGTEVDPMRHEVVHRTESDEPEGTIAEVYRPGYEMADSMLREAQVVVSDGPAEADEE